MSSRWQRLARGGMIGIVTTAVAAASHQLAHGHSVGGVAVIVSIVFATLAATAILRARLSLPRLALAVGASQLAFHTLFSLLGGSAVSAPLPEISHHAAVGFLAGGALPHPSAEPAMWAAHAAAAALTVLFLHLAERSVWMLVIRIARVATASRAVLLITRRAGIPPLTPATFPETQRPRGRLRVSALRLRGPPPAPAF